MFDITSLFWARDPRSPATVPTVLSMIEIGTVMRNALSGSRMGPRAPEKRPENQPPSRCLFQHNGHDGQGDGN
eukprot:6704511-Pyramimonas_sp.AAC.1